MAEAVRLSWCVGVFILRRGLRLFLLLDTAIIGAHQLAKFEHANKMGVRLNRLGMTLLLSLHLSLACDLLVLTDTRAGTPYTVPFIRGSTS